MANRPALTPGTHGADLVLQVVLQMIGEGAKSGFPFETDLFEKRSCEKDDGSDGLSRPVCVEQGKFLRGTADSKDCNKRAHLPRPRPDTVVKAIAT